MQIRHGLRKFFKKSIFKDRIKVKLQRKIEREREEIYIYIYS